MRREPPPSAIPRVSAAAFPCAALTPVGSPPGQVAAFPGHGIGVPADVRHSIPRDHALHIEKELEWAHTPYHRSTAPASPGAGDDDRGRCDELPSDHDPSG